MYKRQALIIGEYWEAAAVTFLFMLGDYLESRTIEKTRASIREMLDSAPKVTTVRRDGVDLTIDSEDVVRGDIVAVSYTHLDVYKRQRLLGYAVECHLF